MADITGERKGGEMNVIISGNLTKDVELRFFDSGKIKASFSLAINVYDAVKKEKVAHFFNCEAWDKDAEFIADKFKKGNSLTIQGVFKQESYNLKGEDKIKNIFVAHKVIYTDAFGVVSGVVEKEEKRYTKNNTQIEFIKLQDNLITIKNFNTKKEVKVGDFCTVFGTLTQTEDKKLVITAINIDKFEKQNNIDEGIVKFAETELLSKEELEELPF